VCAVSALTTASLQKPGLPGHVEHHASLFDAASSCREPVGTIEDRARPAA
jgi:hypothetical protein